MHQPLPARDRSAETGVLLDVRKARKQFGGLVAVNDLSFSIRQGEILGLIGPNGAGKSTMFNLISGALPLTAGDIVFRGDVDRRPRAVRDRAARHRPHVPACEAHPADERARQRRARRVPARQRRRAARRTPARSRRGAAARVPRRRGPSRVWASPAQMHARGRQPRRLVKQRIVEIARALASDPLLLLLDEPAAGLRFLEKQELAALLRQLKAEGMTILLVEHDMDFVMGLTDRLVVMDFGEKLAEGLPGDDPARSRRARSLSRRRQ